MIFCVIKWRPFIIFILNTQTEPIVKIWVYFNPMRFFVILNIISLNQIEWIKYERYYSSLPSNRLQLGSSGIIFLKLSITLI